MGLKQHKGKIKMSSKPANVRFQKALMALRLKVGGDIVDSIRQVADDMLMEVLDEQLKTIVPELVNNLPRPMQPAGTDVIYIGGIMVSRKELLMALSIAARRIAQKTKEKHYEK